MLLHFLLPGILLPALLPRLLLAALFELASPGLATIAEVAMSLMLEPITPLASAAGLWEEEASLSLSWPEAMTLLYCSGVAMAKKSSFLARRMWVAGRTLLRPAKLLGSKGVRERLPRGPRVVLGGVLAVGTPLGRDTVVLPAVVLSGPSVIEAPLVLVTVIAPAVGSGEALVSGAPHVSVTLTVLAVVSREAPGIASTLLSSTCGGITVMVLLRKGGRVLRRPGQKRRMETHLVLF